MSKRTGNRKGKRGRGKYNKQYNHERGIVLAKKMRAQEVEDALNETEDKTKGFF